MWEDFVDNRFSHRTAHDGDAFLNQLRDGTLSFLSRR
jgi:hypothetical protein